MSKLLDIECASTKKILVLNLINTEVYHAGEDTGDLIVDYKHCKATDQPRIKYDIVYQEIKATLKNTTEFFLYFPTFITTNQHLLSDSCNWLLIKSAEFPAPLLKDALTELKKFRIQKTLYDSVNATFPDDFKSKYDLKKMEFIEDFTEPIDVNNRLSCQYWFLHYLSTVFDCGKGRLIQRSGTCYLNTVINMIILSKYFKRIAVRAMPEFIKKYPKTEKEIKTPLENTESCPIVSEKTSTMRVAYIFRVLYTVLCGGGLPKTIHSEKDLLIKASGQYFSSDKKHFIRPSIKHVGGGHPSVVMYSFLYNSGISFLVTDSYNGENNEYKIPINLTESAIKAFVKYDWHEELIDLHKSVTYYPSPPHDVIMYFFFEQYLPQINFFKLESVFISIKYRHGNGHAICGFICDGVYKIFDSNGHMFNIDWRYFYTEETYSALKSQIESAYQDDVISMSVVFGIYTNSSLYPLLGDTSCMV